MIIPMAKILFFISRLEYVDCHIVCKEDGDAEDDILLFLVYYGVTALGVQFLKKRSTFFWS